MLKRIYLTVGLLTVFHFLITGAFMKFILLDLNHENIAQRMMFRANHIYILFSGLLLLVIGHTISAELKPVRWQWIAALILMIAIITLNISFYVEPFTGVFPRRLTGYSIYGVLAGVSIHLLSLYIKPKSVR